VLSSEQRQSGRGGRKQGSHGSNGSTEMVPAESEAMNPDKYLRFVDVGASLTGKTRIWRVLNVANPMIELGTVKWQAHWRRYAFCPAFLTVYDAGCLREIAEFIEQQMKARP
jgi:hypothetical protein